MFNFLKPTPPPATTDTDKKVVTLIIHTAAYRTAYETSLGASATITPTDGEDPLDVFADFEQWFHDDEGHDEDRYTLTGDDFKFVVVRKSIISYSISVK